jgi:DNA (cytosine-5)-methyltransferase 1
VNHLGLFEGIGGFSYAAHAVGWKTSAWVEWNPFCQTVLKHHFPYAQGFSDIKEFDGKPFRGTVDIITGGFPCQPYSLAGKRKGKEDDRHLWPEMLRVIREVRPRWVVGENVLGIVNWNGGLVFDEVQADLEAEGYEVQPFVLPACAVNAPHRRDRVWFVAYAPSFRCNCGRNQGEGIQRADCTCGEVGTGDKPTEFINTNCAGEGLERCPRESIQGRGNGSARCFEHGTSSNSQNGGRELGHTSKQDSRQEPEPRDSTESGLTTNNNNKGLQGSKEAGDSQGSWKNSEQFARRLTGWNEHWFEAATRLCIVDDGISRRLDLDTISKSKWRTESLKAAGNAIVPEVAIELYKAINEYEKHTAYVPN